VRADLENLYARTAKDRRNRSAVAVIDGAADDHLSRYGSPRHDNIDVHPLVPVKTQALRNHIGNERLARCLRRDANFLERFGGGGIANSETSKQSHCYYNSKHRESPLGAPTTSSHIVTHRISSPGACCLKTISYQICDSRMHLSGIPRRNWDWTPDRNI